jgi:hypothetical protein
MCCRACSGFELCRAKSKLSDDCCPQCRYFDSCMEEPAEEIERPHSVTRKRPSRP